MSIVQAWGEGGEGLLWQYEVNQHSVHAAFRYTLGQTAEDYSMSHIYDHRQACPESTAKKQPHIMQLYGGKMTKQQ